MPQPGTSEPGEATSCSWLLAQESSEPWRGLVEEGNPLSLALDPVSQGQA